MIDRLVTDPAPVHGELQAQVMAALWRLESATVDQVREALPRGYKGAYNTVQTVLNRLADRGLLTRARSGRSFVYQPKLSEAEYVSRSIANALAGASAGARQAALAQVLGNLRDDERSELQKLARRAAKQRADRNP